MKNKGFTLTELMIILAIIAILAAMILPALIRAKQRALKREVAVHTTNQLSEAPVPEGPIRIVVEESTHVIDFGHGVYYFHETGKDFSRILARFIGDHPELELVAFTGDVARMNGSAQKDLSNGWSDTSDYGAVVGYTVVFRKVSLSVP